MLPAPIIQGTLPAFYLDEDGMARITIPFSMSRAVNQNEVKRFKLKIKNIQGYDYLATLDSSSFSFIDSVATFEINKQALEKSFLIGSFYKAQLAYVKDREEEEVGYYSTVGIIKYTTKPAVEILNLYSSKNNSHSYHYTGTYSQYEEDPVTGHNKKDATEKAYSYRFIIKNDKNVIIEDTGYLIHNNSNDEKYYESQDSFTYTHDLELNRKYTITYMVRTNNGLEVSSFPYKIMEKESLTSDLIQSITPILNYENGYIKIKLQGALDEQGLEIAAKGSFVLTRASESSNYMDWETISEFNLFAQRPSTLEWKDFTIKQGVNYKYAIQQYNKANSLYSKRLVSTTIFADFEDSFLYDGKRQLKIKFNPKMTSFKKTHLEAKLDTLGSKYPFIFRNGQVEYREFPISGLISYLSDEESLFMNTKEQFYNENRIEKDVYTTYKWVTSTNGAINKKLTERSYQKDYLFFYYFDSKIRVYRRWVDFLERPNITLEEYQRNPNVPLTKDYSDFKYFEKYFDATNPSTYEDKIFLRRKELTNKTNIETYKFKTTNEVSYNLQLERDFKMEVLAWLTNGEPKLFRSPTEGNYIVRLMNSSLSPNDQLGRMLHTFTSTAYEIADLTYDALVQYGFVNNQESINTYFKVMSIPLSTTDVNYVGLMSNKIQYVLDHGVYYATGPLLAINTNTEMVQLIDMIPGAEIQIDGASFLIGQTGEFNSSAPIQQIILPARELGKLSEQDYYQYNHILYIQNPSTGKLLAIDPQKDEWNGDNIYYDIQRSNGILTVAYYEEIDNSFSNVVSSEIQEVYGRQFIGEHEDVLNILNNAESNVLSYYQVRNYLRPIIPISSTQDYFENKDNFSELNLYEYVQYFDGTLNTFLYRKVIFEPTDFYDTDYYEKSRLNRSLKYRVSSNPNLKNTRDYEAYRNNDALYIYDGNDFKLVDKESEYNSTTSYFIQEPIHYLLDPQNEEKIYLTKESYELFVDMWRELRSIKGVNKLPIEDTFNTKFNKYSAYLWINSENIDLEKIEYYEVRNMEKFNSYELSVGVYSEFFYRVQIINYDLSNDYSLQQLKTTVRNLEYQLGRDYMLEHKANEEEYLQTLRTVRQTYPALYAQYIMRLTEYLEALEEEV